MRSQVQYISRSRSASRSNQMACCCCRSASGSATRSLSAWTPWQYAAIGRFERRRDDHNARFRTFHVADRLFVCLLEVLVNFRPRPGCPGRPIDMDAGDDDEYPTAPGRTVPINWLHPLTAGQAIMTGVFADVSDACRCVSVFEAASDTVAMLAYRPPARATPCGECSLGERIKTSAQFDSIDKAGLALNASPK